MDIDRVLHYSDVNTFKNAHFVIICAFQMVYTNYCTGQQLFNSPISDIHTYKLTFGILCLLH